MAAVDLSTLRTTINTVIVENDEGAITATALKNILLSIVDAIEKDTIHSYGPSDVSQNSEQESE